jgi:hypothetical protein
MTISKCEREYKREYEREYKHEISVSVSVSSGMKCKQRTKLYSTSHLSPEAVRTLSRMQDDLDHGSGAYVLVPSGSSV